MTRFLLFAASAALVAMSACQTIQGSHSTLEDILSNWRNDQDQAMRLYCSQTPAERTTILSELHLNKFLLGSQAIACPMDSSLVPAVPYVYTVPAN